VLSILGTFRRKHKDMRCNNPEDCLISHVSGGRASYSVGTTLRHLSVLHSSSCRAYMLSGLQCRMGGRLWPCGGESWGWESCGCRRHDNFDKSNKVDISERVEKATCVIAYRRLHLDLIQRNCSVNSV
jgi:hypothetical protein